MKLIVGLGNPGKKYEGTRHNAGFLVLDELKTRMTNYQLSDSKQIPIPNSSFKYSKNAKADYWSIKIGDEKVELVKPQTFMNESGHSVAYARNKHKIPNEDIYVIHDDLDIQLGEYKIQKGKGPKDHNGLNSIYEKLGTHDFWHVRVGIENRRGKLQIPNAKFQTNSKAQISNSKNTTHHTSHESRISGEDYVLMKFIASELDVLEKAASKIVEELIPLITK